MHTACGYVKRIFIGMGELVSEVMALKTKPPVHLVTQKQLKGCIASGKGVELLWGLNDNMEV